MKNRNNKKGFTLVELIVVLALVALLLAGASGGILAYSRYAARRQENEYARSIYHAAQSALTHAQASGMLETIRDAAGIAGNRSGDEEELPDRWYLVKGKQENGSVLGSLLEPYMTEDILANAALYLEADLEAGIVYAACYSSRADEFLNGQDGPAAVFYSSPENGGRSYGEKAGKDFGYYGT